MKGSKKIQTMKKVYIDYFKDVPVQKYAAQSIARDEDTIIRWKKQDKEFADAIQIAKADWIRKKLIATKAEFALERLEKEIFSPFSKLGVSIEAQALQERNNLIHFSDPKSKKIIEGFDKWLLQNTMAENSST